VGVLLALKASSLTIHWEMIGPDAWGGTTDPGREDTYRFIGAAFAVFSLVLVALSFRRWLRETDRMVQK
jgi:hypothetical protein